MIKVLMKKIYMTLIKCLDIFLKGNVDKNNITVFMTFKEDVEPIIKSLINENYKVTIIYHPKYENIVSDYKAYKTINMKNKYFLQQIAQIKKSRIIIIDTYYLLLGSITKPVNQTVIQTWHAAGALKKFGLEDKSVDLNNPKTVKQYLDVYHYTDFYLIGSDHMAEIFDVSLDAKPENMLKIGLPRLDKYKTNISKSKKKKIVLYAPTYRDYNMSSNIELNKELFEANCPEFELITKLHPALSTPANEFTNETRDIQTLMSLADVIITDYSSLSIEAAFLNKPVIFYVYDEDKYNSKRGLNKYYYEMTKTNKANNLKELYSLVNNHKINKNMNEMWHKYNNGNSTKLLLEFIKKEVG